MLGALIGALAPMLLGRLFGGDPAAAYRKQVGRLTDPRNVGAETNAFYQMLLGSPAFSQAQGAIAAGANQAGNQLAQSLGSRGIGTSGTGAVLSSLIPSLVGSQQGQLRTTAYGSAQQQAMDRINAQISALQGSMPASQNRQLFAGGLDAFGPLLAQWLASRGGGGLPYNALQAAAGGNGGYQAPARR